MKSIFLKKALSLSLLITMCSPVFAGDFFVRGSKYREAQAATAAANTKLATTTAELAALKASNAAAAKAAQEAAAKAAQEAAANTWSAKASNMLPSKAALTPEYKSIGDNTPVNWTSWAVKGIANATGNMLFTIGDYILNNKATNYAADKVGAGQFGTNHEYISTGSKYVLGTAAVAAVGYGMYKLYRKFRPATATTGTSAPKAETPVVATPETPAQPGRMARAYNYVAGFNPFRSNVTSEAKSTETGTAEQQQAKPSVDSAAERALKLQKAKEIVSGLSHQEVNNRLYELSAVTFTNVLYDDESLARQDLVKLLAAQ